MEGCDAGELGFAGRACLVRLAKDALRRGDPSAGVTRGRGRRLDVGLVRKRADDLGERGHAGDRRGGISLRGIALLLESLDLGAGRLERVQPFARSIRRRPRLVELLARLDDPFALLAEGRELQVDPLHVHLRHAERVVEPLEPEDALQHRVALGGRRLQELGEAVLRQQDGATERLEVHAEDLFDPLVHRALERHHLEDLRVGRVVGQQLELMPGRALAPERSHGPPHLPVHLEPELDVRLVGQLVDQRLRGALHLRRLPVQRERHRVEDRGLPRADRTDDRDQPPAAPIERDPLAVGAEPFDRQLKRSHRPPPRARRGRGRAARRARPRRAPAGSTRRTAPPRNGGPSPSDRDRSPPAAGRARARGTGTAWCARSASVMSVPLVFTVRSRNAPASSSVRASIASHVSCTRTRGRPLCSGMLSATASRPGSASTTTTRFSSPASPKSSARSEPAYSRGDGRARNLLGRVDVAHRHVLRSGGDRLRRGRVGVAHVELAFPARGIAPHRHAVHQEVRDQDRHQVGAGAFDERLVVPAGDRRDAIRVPAVPLAGVLHEVDDLAFPEEREAGDDHRQPAQLIGSEDAAFVGTLHVADQMHAERTQERRERLEEVRGVVVAGDGDHGPARGQPQQRLQAERERVRGRGRSVPHVAGDDDQVHLVLVGDALDLGEHLDELVHAVVPAQPLADVPVRRVEDLHVRGEGVAGRVTGPRTDRRRRPSPLPPSWWPTAGTGTSRRAARGSPAAR